MSSINLFISHLISRSHPSFKEYSSSDVTFSSSAVDEKMDTVMATSVSSSPSILIHCGCSDGFVGGFCRGWGGSGCSDGFVGGFCRG